MSLYLFYKPKTQRNTQPIPVHSPSREGLQWKTQKQGTVPTNREQGKPVGMHKMGAGAVMSESTCCRKQQHSPAK